METPKKGTTIQSLQIGIGIIDIIAKEGRPLKFSDICELTKITKSNLYKYLNTLTQSGILYRDKESSTYILGSKLIEYGMAATAEENVIDRITPFMQEMNAESLSTVLYSIWTTNGPMIVKEVNTKQGYNIGAQVGTFLPVLSANGKVFATFLEDQVIEEWIQKELSDLSEEKMLRFKEECEIIKEREISFAREPLVSNVSSVAFPVFNYKKKLLGAITVVGFSELIPTHEEEELSKYLIRKSIEISGTFGYKREQ
ncbi:IclR family transcriptional regulator [Alkalihalobacillus deserti]|uniref:IclR family transcriptional regulator n=1 Tax=Alkalihalobacillus deserti TaxID=2879466 RepID=UPI001D14231B|nr:IclR family transcriptional regulator C-terminal domain-containing protein [Alkalihalobacillus deserti]